MVERLEQLLSAGESQTIEFMAKLPGEVAVARVLSAFANTDGGTVIVGVNEAGEPVGITSDEAMQIARRLEHIANSLLPAPHAPQVITVQGQPVVYLTVNRLPEHLSPLSTATGETFRRFGTENKHLYQQGTPQTRSILPQVTRTLTVFVAMSFRLEEEPALVDYFCAMQRAAKRTSPLLSLTRMDLVEGDYEISQELMQRIDAADLIICDFTLSSNNVYFELGYARAKKKKVIQLARRGTALEFDIRNWRTIFYRNATELEEKLVSALESASAELTAES